jgi:hypothetical protein
MFRRGNQGLSLNEFLVLRVRATVRIYIKEIAQPRRGEGETILRTQVLHTRQLVSASYIGNNKVNEQKTCKISSKSRAANLFISDVLFEKVRITLLPKAGT